ncbi:hypothetical protein VP01_3118g1 [Puccinia sorghi]|uniref:Retrovirus-related Pol polyprotein from transposon TNT 1-94-like beta-barrel domain-containing protein n=1 Tax=Puccinia sorghi TaxID=27349 RepID=A0A0L6UZ94_9BASI|nr:hypothetical protein VP01_3118g1 [Puccinia sorghi]
MLPLVLTQNPAATLTKLQEIVHLEESRKNKTATNKPANIKSNGERLTGKKKKSRRQVVFCEPGKHNPLSTTHTADQCYQVYPELRPKPVATTQLVEADEGHESEVSLLLTEADSKLTVLDSGATHHMVNNPSAFIQSSKSVIKISTGGHSNFLTVMAIGTAILTNHLGEQIMLENALLVPNLNRSLVSIPRVFKKTLNLTKKENNRVEIVIDGSTTLLGSLKNNLNSKLAQPVGPSQSSLSEGHVPRVQFD